MKVFAKRRAWGSVLGRAFLVVIGAVQTGLLTGCVEKPRAGWLGVNAHLGYAGVNRQGGLVGPDEGERRSYSDLIAELHVPMVRDVVMCWGRIEPARSGRYDFSAADEIVRRTQVAGGELLALCRGIPRWAAAGPGTGSIDLGVPSRQYADAFVKFVRAFVERYDGDGLADMRGLRQPIHCYEFMNEIEDVPTGEYAYWLKLFYDTVKKADPRAVVVLGALRSPGVHMIDRPEGDYPTYFERLLAEEGLAGLKRPLFDVVSFHYYPVQYPGRSEFEEPLGYLRQVMAAHGLDLPIWLTEYGCNGRPKEEVWQAENVVKWAIRARALGIERVYMYCLWDRAEKERTVEGDHMGLVRGVVGGGVPYRKPAFQAFRTLLAELKDRPGVTWQGEGLYKLTGSTGGPVYVIWREESHEPLAVPRSSWWNVRTISGGRFKQQGASIEVTSRPLFLERSAGALSD